MKKHSIGSRVLSLLLAAVMVLTVIPTIDVSAASIGEDGYLGSLKPLNNGESITLPIKVNNFAMDGLMFEYLNGTHDDRDSRFYQYEPGGTYQLFTLQLAERPKDSQGNVLKDPEGNEVGKVGYDLNGNHVTTTTTPDDDAMHGVDLNHSLTGVTVDEDLNLFGLASDGTEHQSTLRDYEKVDGGATKLLRLVVADRANTANSDRAWRKLTRFEESKTIAQSRYAVIIYRVNCGLNMSTKYNDMLLTWNYFDEVRSGVNQNCSQTVPVAKNTTGKDDQQWQYAIIDLAYELGDTEEDRATAATGITIEDIYLRSPLGYDADKGKSIDLAAVAYFPYYGDAEQFAHYGLTLGCLQKYYERDNRGFNFREAASGYLSNNYSVEQWDENNYGGAQVYLTNSNGVTWDTINSISELSYALFGETKGYASVGLLESQLGENGRPVYKEVAVDFVAYYLQRHLTAIEEYPADNYGWKNYNFVTGVSTTSGVDDALFGKDELGHSIDLATALCDCVTGTVKGAGVGATDAKAGTKGTYADTRAKANELIGTWDECKDNIDTWFDAAYYLLHNLYVTDEDAAYNGDGYGEYENDYQSMVLPQVDYRDAAGNVKKAYAFDSSFCIDGHQYHSAVVYDTDKHILGMNPAMNETSGMLPFLPTSGNGTEAGESNTPYYADQATDGVYGRKDYHFTISGNGFFQYERDLFFDFKGDDDVYLFINGQLVMDIGGTHNATESKIKVDDYVDWAWAVKNGTNQYKGLDYAQLPSADRARIDALALEEGVVYSFDFFYMERHGAGSTLRIVTNMEVTAEGLNVDKSAYQNGIEIAENGIVDLEKPIEYGFKITNDSENKLKRLTFQDSVIGVSIDYENGLQISEECKSLVRNESGNPLTVADLEILVSGKDADGNDKDVVVTCYNNEELKAFLEDLTSNDGTLSGDGLWVGASIQIRGIYYTMTDAQKEVGSFRNYVAATANSDGIILRGADDHTVYQAGNLAYYQWVGKPVVIERARFYQDVLDHAVGDANDLPALGNMILVPSDANGIERQDNGIVNTRGGDIYLKLNYTVPGTYIAYVTIRDQTNPSRSLTVPVTVYATDAKDSAMVLDYGLDSYLTDNDAIFDNELNLAVGENVTGTVMGIAAEGITPSYKEYDTGSIETVMGNTENKLTLVSGSYADTQFNKARFKLNTPIYLEHTKPWVIEFEVGSLAGSSCLFSLEPTRETDGNLQLNLYKSKTYGDITLGYYSSADSKSYDYGARTSYIVYQSQMTHIKLYNVPAGDGTNMVYCSINNNPGVAMEQVYHSGGIQTGQTSTWISGKDFTFKYIGCNGNSNDYGLNLKMTYLHVYQEDENQLTHYRWEKNGTSYECVNTGKNGYETNVATACTDNSNRWELSNNVVLNSDRAWEIEFAMQTTSTSPNLMLFSSTESEQNGKTSYVNIVPSKRLVSMGSVVGGKYVGYAVELPSSFDMTKPHTYLLKNRINADGTNMVYLYVDKDENGVWSEVGSLHYYSVDSSIGAASTGLSGMDFSFGYIGGYGDWGITDHAISYIEVHEDTALRTTYQWTAGTDEFTSNGNATSDDGNRIEFTKDEDGIVADDSGTFTLDNDKLKFETSDFMDQAYTTYVAMTIHDKDHVPTPLNQTGVNVAKEVQMYKKVSVIPANVVYYEDDFPAIHYVTGNENTITSIGTSTLEQLQSPNQDAEYGSDPFYQNNSSDKSGDHIYKIDIGEDDSSLAWFEFKGTGFELISTTNADNSAMIYVQVYKKGDVTVTGTKVTVNADALKMIPVIPEFDHQNNDGDEAIYQVPLLRWQREDDVTTSDVNEALEAGEYVVTINAYATYDYSQGDKGAMLPTYLYIDGIRIFQPMGYDADGYTNVENKVLFDEVRDYIIDGKINACEKTEAGVIISSGTVTWTEKFTGRDYTGTFFEGNKVNSVNDYLLKGPNNEVYMDGTETESSLAFIVYRNPDEQYRNRDLGLQIGVRAIDVGNFYGAASTGMKANLEIGVTDASGSCGWMHLATVSTGTEQYITVPYELCPVINNDDTLEYHVVIRVSAFTEDIPAMVSFSSLKRSEGLELKEGIGEALTIYQDDNGVWCTDQGHTEKSAGFVLLSNTVSQDSIVDSNNAVRGENFVNDTVVPDGQPAILPQYPALSFEEEVQYHVFYTVQNLGNVALEDMGLITFDTENLTGTVSDAMDVIPGAVDSGEQYIVHTNGISAKKLGDTLYFKVYAKLADGSFVYSDLYNYSAKTYAMNQLKGTNDAVKPLVVAMLNYGAAAQEFFGYKTDSLMNAELSADQQALVQKYHSDMFTAVVPVDSNKVGTFVSNSGFTRMRPSVTFGGAFSINYFFTPAYALDGEITLYYWDAKTYNSVDVLTVENALGSKTMVSVDGGEYFAAYTDIAAKKIGDTVYVAAVYESNGVTYCTGVLPYSLSLYCKRFAENSESAAQDLAAATMVYGYYAEQFFGG